MAQKLTLEALETLDMIDRKGSFSAAAAALYRVPSAISYTIQKLEQDIDVSLFKKEGRRSVLTPAGRILLAQGREILDATNKLIETTRQVDSGWESTLNVAVDSIMDINPLFPDISALYGLKPDIEINLFEEVLGGSWEAIKEERADIIVGASEPPTDQQGITLLEIGQIHWLFCVASQHPLAKLSTPLSESDIQAYPAVVVRDSSQRAPHLSRRLFSTQAKMHVQNMQQKINVQKAGIAVGYLPDNRISSELKDGSLMELNIEGQTPVSTPVYAAWKSNNSGKALKWLASRLADS